MVQLRSQEASLAYGAKHHFRVAALQVAGELPPNPAEHLAPGRLINALSISTNELCGFVGWAAQCLENERGEVAPAGGYRIRFARTAAAAATPSLLDRACLRGAFSENSQVIIQST